jgi:small subunit ribosomal protein S11
MAEAKAKPAKKAAAKKGGKKKVRRVVVAGFAHILAGPNNTMVTITDQSHETIAWSSAGSSGFKGSRKSTPYAAQTAAKTAAEKAREFGLEKVNVYVKGVGSGREQAVRGLAAAGITIESITDATPVPHGGCRPRRPRRV